MNSYRLPKLLATTAVLIYLVIGVAVVQATDLTVDGLPDEYFGMPGEGVVVEWEFTNNTNGELCVPEFSFENSAGWEYVIITGYAGPGRKVQPGESVKVAIEVFIPENAKPGDETIVTMTYSDPLQSSKKVIVGAPEPVDPGTDGLIAYYTMENDANDSSGNGLNGTIVGDPNFVEGIAGMALDFNGDDYVDCGNDERFSVTEYLTVALWVNIRTIPTAWTGVITKGNTAWRISNFQTTQRMHFAFENGSRGWQAANSETELNADEWYHVCGVYDINVGAKIYINGVEDGSNPDTGGITQNTSIVAIGTNSDATYPEQAWDGLLDEIMIFDRALSEDEVKYLAGERAPKANIIFVSFHGADDAPSAGAADAGFTEASDKGYTDLLTAAGYGVTRYIQTGTPDVNMLNAADLVIISRACGSTSFQGDAATRWNTTITAPIINLHAWTVRKSRLGFVTASNNPADATGNIKLTATDPTHPIFAGISMDANNVMTNDFGGAPQVYPDGTLTLGVSISTDPVNAEGTVLATVSAGSTTGPENAMVIAEWPAGATLTHDGGAGTDVLAGRRMVLYTGSRENGGKSGEGTGVFDLAADGAQIFLNAVAYMLPVKPTAPVHSYTFEDGTTNDSVGGADGVLVGGAEVIDGAMVTTAQDQWMEMPGDVIAMGTYPEVTIEAWYTPTAGANTGWSMLAYFGDNVNDMGNDGFFITSARGDDKSRAAISCGNTSAPYSAESGADGPEYDDGLLHHMVSTLNATDITLYIDGVLMASTPLSATNSISCISPNFAYLAKGGYGGDPEWIGAIEEFNIYDKAMSAAEVAVSYAAGPQKVVPVGPGTEGLVAYYALEGDAMDSSGNGLDGTLATIGDANANDAIFVAGVDGMAIDLLPSENGTIGPYVNCGADPMFDLVDAITVGAWVNFRSVPDEWRAIVAKGDSAWRIGNVGATTALHFGFCGYGSRPTTHGIDGATEVGFDSWHYVCGTYDITDGAKLYVDSVLDVEVADTAGIALNTFDVTIGANMEDTGWKPYRLFDGQIDEVRIYDRALSAAEVLYHASN